MVDGFSVVCPSISVVGLVFEVFVNVDDVSSSIVGVELDAVELNEVELERVELVVSDDNCVEEANVVIVSSLSVLNIDFVVG